MNKVLLKDVAIEYKQTIKEKSEDISIVGLEHLEPENILLENWDVGKENTFTKGFKKGHILFGRRRAYLKKAALAQCEGVCSGDITVIEAKDDKIDPKLLPFIIQNERLFDYAVKNSAGSLSPRVKWEHLQNYEFVLPEMTKQKEISDILWSMENTKRSYEKMKNSLDDLIKSQFIEMVGTLKNNKYDFNIVSLGSVADILNGYAFKSKLYEKEGIRVIRITNVQKGFIEDSEPMFYPFEMESEIKRYLLKENDILISLTGNVGRVGMLSQDLLPAALNQRVACIRPKNNNEINLQYLYNILNNDSFENDCVENASGIAQKNMSTDWLSAYKIILPPINIQNKVARNIELLDKSKFEIEQALENLKKAQKSLLDEIFSSDNL